MLDLLLEILWVGAAIRWRGCSHGEGRGAKSKALISGDLEDIDEAEPGEVEARKRNCNSEEEASSIDCLGQSETLFDHFEVFLLGG